MFKKFHLALALLVLAGTSFADEIFWVKLHPRYAYQDIEYSCSDLTHPLHTLYFMAKVRDGKAIAAELRDGDTYYIGRAVLNAEEIKDLVVEKDTVGDYWLKQIRLSTRLLGWVIDNVDHADPSLFGCRPPQRLSTIAPGEGMYTFIQKDALEYFAPKKDYSGKRVDGKNYVVKIGFSQTMLMTP